LSYFFIDQEHPMELGEALLSALGQAGVREIFGIPGDFVLPLFKVIEERCPIPLYTLCHEPAVGFAADGASRWHGNPTAAVVTYGAGALNMVNPVAAAYAEKSPVVVISGGPGISEDHTELLLHHQAKRLDSQFEIYREVTCAQTRLSDLVRAESEIDRVLKECRRQSRPVYIEVPRDLVFSQLPSPAKDSAQPSRLSSVADQRAVVACVDEIIELLTVASSPVLMVGVEVRRFGLEDQVAELARRLGIPVVTSFMGRGLLVGSQAPLIGTYLGVAGDPEITDLVENSDALLMLGVILSDTNFGISKKKIDLRRSIQVRDGQVNFGFHVYPQVSISDLITELMTRPLPSRQAAPFPSPVSQTREFQADDSDMTPDDISAGLNFLVPRGQPLLLSCDIGDCLFTAMDIDQAKMIGPGYYASMGFGVPAGLGLQVASGQRPVILVGDGAFQMTGWELGNCPRYGWDPIVIVMNNASWEMLRAFQPESQFNLLNEWNFAEIARALGGDGTRVRTRSEFSNAFQSAVKRRGKFQLIEVMLKRGIVSRAMDRYTKGLRAFRQSLQS
jgi:indolepyruvate decarboxylase